MAAYIGFIHAKNNATELAMHRAEPSISNAAKANSLTRPLSEVWF